MKILYVTIPKKKFKLDGKDSFIIRVDELQNIIVDYKHYDNIVAMNDIGEVVSIEKGSLSQMSKGELWVFKRSMD